MRAFGGWLVVTTRPGLEASGSRSAGHASRRQDLPANRPATWAADPPVNTPRTSAFHGSVVIVVHFMQCPGKAVHSLWTAVWSKLQRRCGAPHSADRKSTSLKFSHLG